MPSLSELEVLVLELHSVSLKPVSRLLAFQNYSQPDRTQWQLRVVSTLLSVICIMMIGDGIFMIQSRVVIGLEIRMLFNI